MISWSAEDGLSGFVGLRAKVRSMVGAVSLVNVSPWCDLLGEQRSVDVEQQGTKEVIQIRIESMLLKEKWRRKLAVEVMCCAGRGANGNLWCTVKVWCVNAYCCMYRE